MNPVTTVSRSAWYYRHIPGTDFSMEANTPATPSTGAFFLLRGDQVLLQSTSFGAVESAYKRLCATYWEVHLASDHPGRRMSSAWGLLGLDQQHPAAAAVVRLYGTDADQRRMETARRTAAETRRTVAKRGR